MSAQPSFDTVDVGDELPPLQLTLNGPQVRAYALAANMPGGRMRVNLEWPAGMSVPMQWYSLHANRWFYETNADPEGMDGGYSDY
jgi:hypothetical protein